MFSIGCVGVSGKKCPLFIEKGMFDFSFSESPVAAGAVGKVGIPPGSEGASCASPAARGDPLWVWAAFVS